MDQIITFIVLSYGQQHESSVLILPKRAVNHRIITEKHGFKTFKEKTQKDEVKKSCVFSEA